MDKFIREEHSHRVDRELLYMILENQFLIHQKLDNFMSQTSDLLAKLSDDLTVIGDAVTGIAQEIADLKAGVDDPVTVAKLTDLETRASAAGASLKALLPAAPVETPAPVTDAPPVV